MERQGKQVTIPNPHEGDIGTELLLRILRQGQISREEFEAI